MLSFRTFISTGALDLAALVLPSTASAAIVSPWVHAQGVGFTDQNGLPVVLRGVNQQGGAGIGSNGMALSLGSNFVRILAPWSTVEDTAPVGGLHTWNEDHGVNVLVDFHQYKWSPYFGSCRAGSTTTFVPASIRRPTTE
jgi:hypothetical protein